MAKSNLETAINEAAGQFALSIIEAVKGATLQELIALQTGGTAPVLPATEAAPKRGPGRPKKIVSETAEPTKKKRVVKNYPKCAYPRCNKNRFVRGKGFCGDHWRMWLAGKIKSAEYYQSQQKKGKGKSPRVKKR